MSHDQMEEEECDGCFRPISECVGYGSCVKRLRRVIDRLTAQIKSYEAVVDIAERMRRRYSPEALSVMMGQGFVVELNKRLDAIPAPSKVGEP